MDFDMEEYLGIFLEDAQEQIELLNTSLLGLEENPDNREILDTIFRVAHTLKGGSATVGLDSIAHLTHEMETVLHEMRNGKVAANMKVVDALFDCLDALKSMLDAALTKQEPDVDIGKVVNQLHTALDDPSSIPSGEADAAAVQAESPNAGEASAVPAAVLSRLDDLEAACKPLHRVRVRLAEGSQMRAMRAYLVQNNLSGLGETLCALPDPENEAACEETAVFEFWLAGAVEAEAIVHEAKVIDVEEVEVEEIPLASLKAPAPEGSESERPKAPAAPQAAADKAPAAGAAKAATGREGMTIRVDIQKLDYLMNLVGELVIIRTQYNQIQNKLAQQIGDLKDLGVEPKRIQELKSTDNELDSAAQQLAQIANNLQESVMQVRMVPVGSVFNRFLRIVRDLAKNMNKEIDLVVEGSETELDKTVVDEIADPLVHLVRNSVDHGIEPPEVREAKGKPRKGTVRLNAHHEGNHVVIVIEDDGAGIDAETLARKAVEKGVKTQEEIDRMDERAKLNLIFAAGFSTAEKISDVSGRGVGMDVVRRNMEKLNALIDVQTEVGKGSKLALKIPLTMAIIQALLVEVAGEVNAIPLVNVLETVRLESGRIKTIEGREVVTLRGEVLSLLRLKRVFGYEEEAGDAENTFVVVIGVGSKRIGLIVDKLCGQQEIVIKSLGDYLKNAPGVSGASIMGDGQVSLILDVGTLVEMGIRQEKRGKPLAAAV